MMYAFNELIFFFQKYLEMEDSVEGEKKELQEKIESLESIVRMLELKAKNSSDHGKLTLIYVVIILLYINDRVNENSLTGKRKGIQNKNSTHYTSIHTETIFNQK